VSERTPHSPANTSLPERHSSGQNASEKQSKATVVPDLTEKYGEREVPIDPRLQDAFKMTVDVLSEIVGELKANTLDFQLADLNKVAPVKKPTGTMVPVSLLSHADHPDNMRPARFTVHLFQSSINRQTGKFIDVKTSARRQAPKPNPGEIPQRLHFIRDDSEEKIALLPEFFDNNHQAAHIKYKRNIKDDFDRAVEFLTGPTGETVVLDNSQSHEPEKAA